MFVLCEHKLFRQSVRRRLRRATTQVWSGYNQVKNKTYITHTHVDVDQSYLYLFYDMSLYTGLSTFPTTLVSCMSCVLSCKQLSLIHVLLQSLRLIIGMYMYIFHNNMPSTTCTFTVINLFLQLFISVWNVLRHSWVQWCSVYALRMYTCFCTLVSFFSETFISINALQYFIYLPCVDTSIKSVL